MKISLNRILILLVVALLVSLTASAQTTESTSKAWVKKGDWRNGVKLDLYKDLNNEEFAIQYRRNKAYWDKAFAFIANTQLDTLSVGKHLIDGENVFATVSDGPTKDYNKTGWEAHRKYIDLHLMIHGKERIGMMDPATAAVTNPYDAAKDVVNFDTNTKGNYYVADPGTLFIFFPQNPHRPGIHVEGYDTVKKLVIKIKVAD
ncbi:YhcH/YjgK/YiaL family protein [Mucilaginibacter sp. UR6-11]|uniref:YhcH/YjgK/YiaL family protein n=1 Tax=Mucilaginibacter sp. UR6-11 TaxID=1435644 RepID=UPI001E5210AA|nr:YhcH/YjgK/YiaL family protein [Mucilaginibacter sp. UR6-11]MCC8425455.1 YhcH/YjgK/YiaL family protein [Mucilaginibacter sp. UR6-11]